MTALDVLPEAIDPALSRQNQVKIPANAVRLTASGA